MSGSAAAVGLSSSVKRFCGYTSAHGLGRFSEQSSFIGRLIWVSFLLGTYSGFAYHLSILFERFMQAPVLTTMTVSTLPFQFPDVYICPAHAVTMSKVIKSQIELANDNVEYLTKKTIAEKIGYYNFDLTQRNRYGNYEMQLNGVTKAIESVLESTEKSLMEQLQFPASTNRTECRTTLSGEEYSGNVSSAVIYGFTSMTVTSVDGTTFEPSPYRSHRQCMRWNDAASRLNLTGSFRLAEMLFALNFSDSESRCRSPPGLPLSEFFSIATRPQFQVVGCLNRRLLESPAFNFPCSSSLGITTYESCAECCATFDFAYIALNALSCFCGSDVSGFQNSSEVCDMPCRDDDTRNCGSVSAVTVLQIRDKVNKPLRIGNFSQLKAHNYGPYCFFTDDRMRLNAAFCEIPFCEMSTDYDCSVSSADALTEQLHLSRYTGRRNVTASGRQCMPWSQVSNIENISQHRSFALVGEMRKFYIRLPDEVKDGEDNFCRPASVVVDSADHVSASGGRPIFVRHNAISSDVPVCIPVDFLLRMSPAVLPVDLFFQLAIETCDIPKCYASIPSVTSAIRESVGAHLLARQFGSDLSVGLADCSFAGQKCTKEHFVNVAHPQLGMCHQFLKQHFTANMTSTQLAESQLSIKYFTDSTDSKGQTVSNIDKLTGVVRGGRSSDASQVAFKAIIVPESSFPWASKGIDVATAQRMDVQLRFDKYSRLSTASRPCLETTEPITYRLPSWKLSPLHDRYEYGYTGSMNTLWFTL